MLELAGIEADPAVALRDGAALERYRAMVVAQGGDPDAALAQAPHIEVVTADRPGIVGRLDARAVGVAAWRLGAGRARKEDAVSAVGRRRCASPNLVTRWPRVNLYWSFTPTGPSVLDWAREALEGRCRRSATRPRHPRRLCWR